jgi:hypothetical protein
MACTLKDDDDDDVDDEKCRNHKGRDLDSMADILMGFHRSTFFKPNT